MMKRDRISIDGNMVSITGNNIWMTDYELTDLLGVTSGAVRSHIKSIFKSGVLSESDTYCYIHLENGNRADTYNMEMITALAFRLNSLPAKIFRELVVRKAVTPYHPSSCKSAMGSHADKRGGRPCKTVYPLVFV